MRERYLVQFWSYAWDDWRTIDQHYSYHDVHASYWRKVEQAPLDSKWRIVTCDLSAVLDTYNCEGIKEWG